MRRPFRHLLVALGAWLACSAQFTLKDSDVLEKLHRFPDDVARRLLTLYDAGDYEAFDEAAARLRKPSNWLHFEKEAKGWIDESPDRARRRVVSASVALELAYAQQSAWPLSAAFVEVGCALLRDQDPTPGERQWHLASAAMLLSFGAHYVLVDEVLKPGEQYQFERERERYLKEEKRDAGIGLMRRRNVQRAHLRHSAQRFPDSLAWVAIEGRLREYKRTRSEHGSIPAWLSEADAERLVQRGRDAIAGVPSRMRMSRASAAKLLAHEFELPAARHSIEWWDIVDHLALALPDEALAAEAHLRRGVAYLKLAQPKSALEELQHADRQGRTPFVRYLARFMGGYAMERAGDNEGALRLYQGALDIVPRAQSASFNLAPLLFHTDPESATLVMSRAVTLPLALDYFDHYFADPAEWPTEIARLRAMLR